MPDQEGSGTSDQTKPAALEIEGKTYSQEDLTNLVKQHGEITQKSQLASKALTAAERYQVDVDTYVQNAEASFALMNQLIQEGVIDESGKIIKKETQQAAQTPTQRAVIPGLSKAENVSVEALTEFHKKFGTLEEEVNRLREDNVGLMRLRLQDKLADQFPDLDEDDIAKVMATAYRANGKKPVVEIAKEASNAKKEWMLKQEEAFAKKYGLDTAELNRKRQFIESDPAQGAGLLAQGKKMVFQPKKGDTNAVTPKQAMAEFMRRRMES